MQCVALSGDGDTTVLAVTIQIYAFGAPRAAQFASHNFDGTTMDITNNPFLSVSEAMCTLGMLQGHSWSLSSLCDRCPPFL